MSNTVKLMNSVLSLDQNWDSVRDNLYLALINYKENEYNLTNIIHIPFLDLAFVIYYRNPDDWSEVILEKKHPFLWGVSEREVLCAARENTYMAEKVVFMLLDEAFGIQDEFSSGGEVAKGALPLYILTNKDMMFGAALMGDTGLLSKISKGFNSDLFILPSSVHEILIIPVRKEYDVAALREIVVHVNGSDLEDGEYLSDEVYYFSREMQNVGIATPVDQLEHAIKGGNGTCCMQLS